MSILDTLIYDRTQGDLERLRSILRKLETCTWDELPVADKIAWLYGDTDPLYTADGPLHAADGLLYVLRDGQPRGAYNHQDLNRVEGAVAYLAQRYRAAPEELEAYAAGLGVGWDGLFTPPYDLANFDLATKTDWTPSDLQRNADMSRYLENIRAMTAGLTADYPTLPDSLEKMDISTANALEETLALSHEALLAETARITELIDRTAANVDLGWALGVAHTGLYGGNT